MSTKAKKKTQPKKKKHTKKDIKPGERQKLVNAAAIDTCYKPDCPHKLFVLTDGHWMGTFDAAHIRDELESAPNINGIGHRFYPADDMTQTQRNQYGNLILLCKSCHKLIDTTAPLDYSVELLHEWKLEAETDELRARLKATFGDRALSEQDWADALIDGSAIKSVHMASEQELEALDNRFSVTSGYTNGQPYYVLDATEPVPTEWKLGGDTEHYAKRWDGMVKRAEPFWINSEDLTIEGSALLSKITAGNEGVMILSPTGTPAVIKLSLVNSDNKEVFRFDDITGSVTSGTEVMVFNGTCFNKLFKLHIEAPKPDGKDGKFNFTFDLKQWDGQDIRALVFFQKILGAVRSLGTKPTLSGTLELNGEAVLKFNNPTDALDATRWGVYQCMHYTEACRNIVRQFDEIVEFDHDIEFSKEEHIAVRETSDFVALVNDPEPRNEYTLNTSHEATAETLKSGSRENQAITGGPLDLFFGIPEMELQLFHKTVSIPRRGYLLSAMSPKLKGASKPKVGETYHVKWSHSEISETSFYFEDEDHPISDHLFDNM